jgi:DNA-binding GntR family transcriptional regulator
MSIDLDLGALQKAKNTAELIADALRSAILQGKLTSGQWLKQDEIAAKFSVSKIPIREALVQLQSEGLVQLLPNRGAVVSSLTQAQVEEIYTMRLALEPIALRRAIPCMTPADFLQLDHILDRIDRETDLSKWAELNWEFHAALYAPAQMPLLIQTARDLHHNVVRLLVYLIRDAHLQESQRQHRELLTLARRGELDAACALLERHLREPAQFFAHRLTPE